MAVRIRLTRTGRKNLPSYRISVFEGRTRRDGPSLEILGWYNPLSKEEGKGFKVDEESLRTWIGKGALLTMPVMSLLRKQGVVVPATAAAKRSRRKSTHKRPKLDPKKASARHGGPVAERRKRKLARRATRKALVAKKAAAKTAAQS